MLQIYCSSLKSCSCFCVCLSRLLISGESRPPGLGMDPPSPIDAVEMEDT